MKASVSPSLWRRSLWPRMTCRQPTSRSMAGLTSPVKAPSFSGYKFCAPSSTWLPRNTTATRSRYGNGGQTAMVMRVSGPNPLTTSDASCSAPAALVNIFQLPAMNFLRMNLPKSIGLRLAFGRSHANANRKQKGLLQGLAHHFGDLAYAIHEIGILVRQQGLGAIGESFFRTAMDLDMDPVGSRRHRGASHARDQVRPARGMAGIDGDRQMAHALDAWHGAHVEHGPGRSLAGTDT